MLPAVGTLLGYRLIGIGHRYIRRDALSASVRSIYFLKDNV